MLPVTKRILLVGVWYGDQLTIDGLRGCWGGEARRYTEATKEQHGCGGSEVFVI